jgi:hypothetical protein
MRAISYRLVPANGVPTQGTDYTGAHESTEAFAVWHRERNPDLVEVAVWAGELADRPGHVLDRLRDGSPLFGDRSQASVLAGAVA